MEITAHCLQREEGHKRGSYFNLSILWGDATYSLNALEHDSTSGRA